MRLFGIDCIIIYSDNCYVESSRGCCNCCVILLHVFNATTINLHLIINELLLLTIGLGIAFIMNLICQV